ncbi:MAG: DUF4259 domain-containing protein [Terriglobales bacterium]|jgi:hypothetical protein
MPEDSMGGWGTGSFENEDAQGFLGRLHSLGIDDLRQILTRAADQDDYLEAPESGIAVAAAEVVAALVVAAKIVATKEAPSPAAPREIMDWISKNWTGKNQALVPSDLSDLVDLARRAVDRVRTNSELKDLWLEAEGLNEWSAALRELKERLSG